MVRNHSVAIVALALMVIAWEIHIFVFKNPKVCSKMLTGEWERKSFPTTKVCIVQIDDRFQTYDMQVASFQSLAELKMFFVTLKNESTLERLLFCQLSLLLNKAYAIRHGYKLLISNMSEYNASRLIAGRSPAWMKINFVHDLMHEYYPNECEWFSYLDSDSYFWMDAQRMSLDEFFGSMSVHEVSLDYDERERTRQASGGFLPWSKQTQIFMIGQSGQFDHEDLGFARKRLNGDFVCTGTWFVKNCDKGREIMRQWRDGIDKSRKTKRIYEKYRNRHPWEQPGFTQLVYPKFQKEISVFPFRDFNKRDGRAIRHVWTQFENERIPRMHEAFIQIMNNTL